MRLFILLSFFISLSACSHYVRNEAGYVRPPVHYTFTYSKRTNPITDTHLIDTTAIYYLSNSTFYRNSDEYKNSPEYIRFYSDGRFKNQGVKDSLKIEDINDINKGIVGYYLLQGNKIKLQFYTDINAGSDQLEFGLIDENKNLILLNENPRTDFCLGYSENRIRRKIKKSSFLNPKRYEKIKVPGLVYVKPNW